MMFSKIISTGSSLPNKIVTNLDLEQEIDTTDEWITRRTGIKQRYIAEDETCVSLGVSAAYKALEASGTAATDIDLIIVATCTAGKIFPSAACIIADLLGCKCAAFDVQAACSGFIYAVTVADKFIKTDQAKNVLVIGTETMSKVVDWKDRSTCVLFGDGAGCVLLGQSDQPGIYATKLCADGKYQDLLYLNNKAYHSDPFLRMDGSSIFKLAVNSLSSVATDVINNAQMASSDINWVVPHQANIRIIEATAKKLNIGMDKVITSVAEHANTSGASIPLALDTAVRQGKIKRGDNLLLEAIGGGLTWGASLVRY